MTVRQETKDRLTAWWEGRAYDDRPCILASVAGHTSEDEAYTADEFWRDPTLMARLRHRWASERIYLGESVPYLYMDYGANAVALQLGAKGDWRDTETIWTYPCCESLSEVEQARRQGPGGRSRTKPSGSG